MEINKKLGEDLHEKVNEIFEEQTRFLARLVRANSINPGSNAPRNLDVETEVAKEIRQELLDMGVAVRYLRARSNRPNLLAIEGPQRSRKSLLLVGHMDTAGLGTRSVIAPFSGLVRNGRMYGLGVLDMKASLSAYVYALKAIKGLKKNLGGKLRMAFTADGKADRPSKWGLSYLLSKGLKSKSAVLAKPGTDKIAIGHRGGYRFVLTTRGEAVNTGRKVWERGKVGKNAIVDMAKVIRTLGDFELPFKQARAFPGRKPVFTFPTKMMGGSAVDMVPDTCVAYGDVRLMPGNTDLQVKLWMQERLSTLPDVKWEIEDLLFVPSMELDRSEPVVQALAAEAKEVLGVAPKLEGCGPWNEAWMLTSKDIPGVAGFGPDGGEEEMEGEWVDLESLKKVTEIYARLIVSWLGLDN